MEIRVLSFERNRVRVAVDDSGRYWWEVGDLGFILRSSHVLKIARKLEDRYKRFGIITRGPSGDLLESAGVSTPAIFHMAISQKRDVGYRLVEWIEGVALPILGQPATDDQREKWEPRREHKPAPEPPIRNPSRGGRMGFISEKRAEEMAAKEKRKELREENARVKLEVKEAPAKLLRQFIFEQCTLYPGRIIPKAEFYAAWLEWSKGKGGYHLGGVTPFGRLLHSLFPRIKSYSKRNGTKRISCYSGISLKDPVPVPEPAGRPDEDWPEFVSAAEFMVNLTS